MVRLEGVIRARLLSRAKPRPWIVRPQDLNLVSIPYLPSFQSPFLRSRAYAVSESPGTVKSSSRKQVTIRNDDGRVQWGDLTVGEKAARTTQQTFNLGIILVGFGMTVRSRWKVASPTLSRSRLVLPTYCTRKCLRQIARPDTLIVPLTESELILEYWTCLDQDRPFEPSGNRQRVNGPGTDRLRERAQTPFLTVMDLMKAGAVQVFRQTELA